MFTGIIKELGTVRNIAGLGRAYKLSVESKDIVNKISIGDSVSV
ncbi:MAG: riboflavin synthase, partial [Candidatus Omnitrophica bacterium]|nr:riboflavin synthase [Candidatus Omnitrophota bacterium]